MENNYNNNNNNDLLPIDLFNRFFGFGRRANSGLFDVDKLFRVGGNGFDDIHRDEQNVRYVP